MRRAHSLRARTLSLLLLVALAHARSLRQLSPTPIATPVLAPSPDAPVVDPPPPTALPTTTDDPAAPITNSDETLQTSTPIPALDADVDPGVTTIDAAAKDSPLSRTAVIAIAAGGGAAVLVLLTIVIFITARRRIHHNDSYYQFTDPADNGAHPVARNPTAPDPNASLYSNAGVVVGSRNNSDLGSSGHNMANAYKTPRFKAPHSHAPAVHSNRAQRIYGDHEDSPTAPSASQFSRRESDASSTSDDTIVAPVYGAPNASSTNTAAAAAPWFHDGKLQNGRQQRRV